MKRYGNGWLDQDGVKVAASNKRIGWGGRLEDKLPTICLNHSAGMIE